MEDKDIIIKEFEETMYKALYPNEEEMKEQINKASYLEELHRLSRESAYLKEVIKKQNKILGVLRRNIRLDENYSTDANGSTRAFKMLVENCVSIEEDEQYTDDCYPNSDFDNVEEWVIYGK